MPTGRCADTTRIDARSGACTDAADSGADARTCSRVTGTDGSSCASRTASAATTCRTSAASCRATQTTHRTAETADRSANSRADAANSCSDRSAYSAGASSDSRAHAGLLTPSLAGKCGQHDDADRRDDEFPVSECLHDGPLSLSQEKGPAKPRFRRRLARGQPATNGARKIKINMRERSAPSYLTP
jgi:hypothetical protein